MTEVLNGAQSATPESDNINAFIEGAVADRYGELTGQLSLVTAERDTLLAEKNAALENLNTANYQKGELTNTVAQMQIERTEHEGRIARMQSRMGELQDEVSRSRNALDSFKAQIVEIASEAADEHGWCDEIDRILDKVGLKREPIKFLATVTITLNIAASRDDGNRGVPDESWVYGCLEVSDLKQAIRDGFRMDSDIEDERILDIEIDVTDTEQDND